MAFRILRKLAGADLKAEAEKANAAAQQSIITAASRTSEIDKITGRVQAHGRRNHFGERWQADLARRAAAATPKNA